MFNVGDAVNVKFTGTIQGEVIGATITDMATVCYLVEYTDHDSVVQQRYFHLTELEAV